MSELGKAILSLGKLFTGIIEIYVWVVIIAALLTFVNPDPYNPIVQFLYRITNPAYSFVKKFIRTNFNNLDLAPLIIIISLQIAVIVIRYLFSVLANLV